MRNNLSNWIIVVACALLAAACGGKVQTTGEQSVYKAAETGDLGTITAAMQKGFNVNTADENGMTMLHHAAQAGQADVIELLTADYGANVNAQDKAGNTPLALAQQNGDARTIELLAQEAGEG